MRYAAFLGLLLILAASCNRDVEGCRDPNSTNYNPDATVDDGSCTYEIDRFCGNWTFTDTVVDQVTMNQEILSRTLVITRMDAHKVRISLLGGSGCLVDVYATGAGNALTIAAADNDEFYCNQAATISGSGQLSGNVLTLNYFWNWFMPNLNDLSAHGKAIKQ
jgi:hypothetical protein